MSVVNQIKKGSTTYDIQDVNAIANPSTKADGQLLTYSSSADKWVAANAPASGVIKVTAGDNSITIGGDESEPTVAAKISNDSGNGLSVRADGLYAAATDLSGVEGRLNTIEGKEAGWDAKYDKPASGIPDSDIASAATWNAKQDVIPANTYDAYGSAATVQGNLDDVTAKIPAEASSSNQLADKSFVNSSVATNTANYISNDGQPFTSVAALEAYSGTVTNNDYAFVTGTDEHGNTYFDRYKATVSGSTKTWAKEYRLNNSSFTSAQWAAISSGLTSTDKTKLDGIAEGANNYVHPAGSGASKSSGLYKISTDSTSHISGATAVQKSDITALGIPAQDTTYSVATTSANGLMSSTDKTKLNGLAAASEVTFTLSSGSWSSKTQTVTVSGITSSTIGIVAVASTATEAQYKAAAKAQLRCTAQGTNSITMSAYGTVPTVNIPCVVTILKA